MMNAATLSTRLGMLGLHQLIEAQAQRTPLVPALYDSQGMLTYVELMHRAEIVSQHLIAAGVRPGELVGLCVDRSMAMIVTWLGILKAGAAYVPLDLAHPAERVRFMFDDAGARFIATTTKLAGRLPRSTAKILTLDALEAPSSLLPTPAFSIDDPAYMIYTSGSTGKPKGVLVTHRNISAFAAWIPTRLSAAQTKFVLGANSLSFDVSVFEICAALTTGGALVIVDTILSLIDNPPPAPVTLALSAPSSLAEVVRARAVPPSLSTIIVGGERIAHTFAHKIYSTTNVTELINTWGVTEDTICATTFAVPRDYREDPPIGKPIAGRTMYLLDENLQAVPPGTTGEMFCAGSGVASGYHNRPELQAEKFIDNPFTSGTKLYRTGDLAFLGGDGELRFLGRRDGQVKVNGQRVELGEIEALVDALPDVAQAAVLLRENTAILDLFIVKHETGEPNLADIQAYLRSKLPLHMIPDTLTVLALFPHGPTGKLDRRALQALRPATQPRQEASSLPHNRYEADITALFGFLLDIDPIGVDANFFALGGKSLLAVRLGTELRALYPREISAIEERLGSEALTLAFAFSPTPRYLAAVLQGHESPPTKRMPVQCIRVGDPSLPALFVLHGVIHGEAFYTHNLAQGLQDNRSLYTLAPHGLDGLEVPDTVEAMAADYVARIRAIQPSGPYHLIGFCNGGLVAYEMASQLTRAKEKIASLILIASPGHNIILAPLKIVIMGIPFLSVTQRKHLFLASREALRLVRYRAQYVWQLARSVIAGEKPPTEKPLERYRRMRQLGNQQQRNDPRYSRITAAIDEYTPPYYAGRVCLIWGRDDEYLRAYDAANQWAQVAPNLDYALVEGGHTFVATHPETILQHFPICTAALR